MKFKKHGDLVNFALLNAQRTFENSVWFKRHVGVFRTFNDTPIRINKPGMSDIYGFIKKSDGNLLWVEIECKLPHDKLSEHQINWKNTVEKIGGIFIEFRNEKDLDKIKASL